MKFYYPALILFFSVQICHAQQYERLFGTESTQWNISIGNLWGSSFTEHYVTGDTMINGQDYKIINGYAGFEEHQGYLRQDSLHEKAWYRNNITDEESLVMDLSLELGDSLLIRGVWNGDQRFHYVDSVYVKDNRKHIRFDFPLHFAPPEKFTLIEGVVSNLGFRYQDNDYLNGLPTLLLWAFKNDVKIYGEGDCTFSSTVDIALREEITIYPNPATTEITLSFVKETFQGKVIIVNQSGRTLLKQSGLFTNKQKIDISNLESGIHILFMVDEENQIRSSKNLIKVKAHK